MIAQVTTADYARVFAEERTRRYPVVDALEERLGFALDRARYEPAARILACPVKVNPPSWQHGRVLYAVARAYLEYGHDVVQLLDIGTAKGFSALCLQWALNDSPAIGHVTSVDVMDPMGRDRRNSVLELDGPKSLDEFLEPWPEAMRITFLCATGREWLTANPGRVHLAFVDGKHTFDAVSREAALLADRQCAGDVIIFDDAQIPAVAQAVAATRNRYELEPVTIKLGRTYVIARRR